MPLPKGKKNVGCKWVFVVKYNSDGSLKCCKAHLVAKGSTQTYGIDYSKNFSHVAKLKSIRVLLSITVHFDWPLQQMDVKNTFLNGELREEVFMVPPPGFEMNFGSWVCRLRKALYRLKQSPHAWFYKFTIVVKAQGYTQGQSDHTLFYKYVNAEKIAILIVYVDNIIITGSDEGELAWLKRKLATEFEIKDLGHLKYFLRMEVARSRKGIVVSQQKYILELLKETRMIGCKPVDTPIDPNRKLCDSQSEERVDTG